MLVGEFFCGCGGVEGVLTVREHGWGPESARGRWLNLLSGLDMVAKRWA